jgi:hypothetical protein
MKFVASGAQSQVMVKPMIIVLANFELSQRTKMLETLLF